jgi:hypothetical protein
MPIIVLAERAVLSWGAPDALANGVDLRRFRLFRGNVELSRLRTGVGLVALVARLGRPENREVVRGGTAYNK